LFKKKRVKRIIKPSYEEDTYVFHALLASERMLQGGREQESLLVLIIFNLLYFSRNIKKLMRACMELN
jgi:hypothetical protein